MANNNLILAKKAKNDEFYTQLSDIEHELDHYKSHFKDKVIYCNCDNPDISNFFKYFKDNFKNLKLKRLITSNFINESTTLFDTLFDTNVSIKPKLKPVVITYDGIKLERSELEYNGDFRSPECIRLLDQSDIVVTNPPFSLFRDYVTQLIKYDKKFLILGNMNAVTYNHVFKLFKEGKLWYGINLNGKNCEFKVPHDYEANTGLRIDSNGDKFMRINGIRWFTNIDHNKRHIDLLLDKKYTPLEYPTYDNYDMINVNKTKEIPMDYDKAMGVPISFLDSFNPRQFEILGIDREFVREMTGKYRRFRMDGKEMYARIVIKRRCYKLPVL